MALFSTHNVSVKGLSIAVPDKIYYNKDYDFIPESERDLFIKTTGVVQRRMAVIGRTASDLCVAAAEELLKKLNWSKESVELLIFVSQTRDYVLPSMSCITQDRLGLSKNCMAFDINLGCSGYVYGLSVISSMMSSGAFKRALLLAGDISTINTAYTDKSTFPLFGDAGTATAVEFSPGNTWYFNLQTDGSGHEAIIIRDAGARNHGSPASFDMIEYGEGIIHNRLQVELHGMEVFNFSLKEVAPNFKELMDYAGKKTEDTDYFIFHQANKLINESIRKKLKLPPEKVPMCIDEFGNTSSSSIPLAMLSRISGDLYAKKNKLVLCGFGVGLSWGTMYFENEPFVCLPLIEVPNP